MRISTVFLGLALACAGWIALQKLPPSKGGASSEPSSRPTRETVTRALVPETLPETSAARAALPRGEDRWTEVNNRATVLLRQGELEQAVGLFERCHAAVPENDVFRSNLAEALIRLGRALHDEHGETEVAILRLERAIELVPAREDRDVLDALLERWRREVDVEGNHWTEGSDLFELSYDTDRVDILRNAQDVLDHLESSYEDLRLWFLVDPVREQGRSRIKVGFYTRDEFDHLTGLGHWAGGVFDGVVRVSTEDLETERSTWSRVLKHELVHAFVHEIGGTQVPGWLNEGLAQWMEGEGLAARVASARARLRGVALFPLERMQGTLASWKDVGAIEVAYAQSLALVDHLIEHYGEETLRRAIVAGSEGKSVATSFREQHGFELAKVLEDLALSLAR